VRRRSCARAALVLAAALGALPVSADDDVSLAGWPTLAGSGLFTLPGADTLRAGGVSVTANFDNRDRDPLGLDLLDGAGGFVVGLGGRAELYGHAIFTRVASLPEAPALPPAPLDLVAVPGTALPAGPYHSYYSLTPYVDKSGTARFDEFVPGDALVGAKLRLSDGGGSRPALALAAELKLPLSKDGADLRSGSGTGGVDLRLRAITQWTAGRYALLATAAYTRTADGAQGDRFLQVDPGGALRSEDRPLELSDRLLLGVGARRSLGRAVAAVLEASADVEVGGHTATLDSATPFDVLAGLQVRAGGARLMAALRYHLGALPSGEVRRSPLGGLVDVTGVSDVDLADYLARLGAGAAFGQLRGGTHRVVAAPASGPALPPGARLLAEEYTIRSEHNFGFLIALGWTF
jgi:hypothetical protein